MYRIQDVESSNYFFYLHDYNELENIRSSILKYFHIFILNKIHFLANAIQWRKNSQYSPLSTADTACIDKMHDMTLTYTIEFGKVVPIHI